MGTIKNMDLKKNVLMYILVLMVLSLSFLVVVLLLIPKDSTSLTELYFEDNENLPSTLNLGQEYPFGVTIHNLEEEAMLYNIKVYLETSEETVDINSFSLKLGTGETYTFDEVLMIQESTGESRLVVSVNEDEIYFWVNAI